MGVTAVIGLQWGDEGKGKVVDVLCERAELAVRCQGGANAGHTVIVDGRTFILHLIPSGILREGTTCLITNGVVLDLDVLKAELEGLEAMGVGVSGRLVISRRAHVVLPLHKQAEQVREAARGERKLDTTRRGIGPAYGDKASRLGIRVGDVLNPGTLPAKVRTLIEAYAGLHPGGEWIPAERILEHCRMHEPMLREFAGQAGDMLRKAVCEGKDVMLEGAQGFLLDVDHGTYPFVTSSNTGLHGLACGAGLPYSAIDEVVGVVKAYMTRVGEGPLPTLMEEPYQSAVREKGREYGATTGRPRRCGWMDLVALRYAASVNGVTSVALTKLDTLSGLGDVSVCESYDCRGERLEDFPPDIETLRECTPRYARCETWGDLDAIEGIEDLPPAAASYIDRITGTAGCGLKLLSVGPGRDQLVALER
jgi:adenylosuccinate synthase